MPATEIPHETLDLRRTAEEARRAGFEKLMTRSVHAACEARFPTDGERRGALARIAAARAVWRAGGYAPLSGAG